MSILFEFIYAKFHKPKDFKYSFAGKTVIVTGANTGVGYEAALKFVQQGASKVILAVRSIKKGEDARSRIEAAVGNKKGKEAGSIEVWELDMLSYPSVKAFAARADKELARLDYAILNAGVSPAKYEQSPYGWEQALQVNVLSTTLLGLFLLPQMRRTSEITGDFTPVLEIVSSGMSYYFSQLKDSKKGHLQAYNNPETWVGITAYGISKVFLEFAKVGLAGLAKPEGSPQADVFVIDVCPGPTRSELARDQTAWYMRAAIAVFAATFQHSTETGSRTYISGVMQGEKGHSGFWQYDRLKGPTPLQTTDKDGKLQAKLWAEIIGALEKDVPEVRELVTTSKQYS
ncbi:hypothetical protein LTR27_000456 [Elasticomyces elasticus]|nr:hypothetical protein LTR27_000456 [Elasticomyces elasticus]